MSQHANSKLGQPLDPDTVQRRLAVIKAQVCVPFDCPRQAEAMLNGLQNLRAA